MTNIVNEFNDPRVMLFSPVRVSLPILKLVLESHVQLQGNIHYVYFDDCEPEASAYLRAWARDRHNVTLLTLNGIPESTYSHSGHVWDHSTTDRIAKVRNAAIKYFQDVTHSPTPAYLFMVDADLILPPGIVDHLVSCDVDVVSEVFWTKWKTEDPYLPNVWDVQPYSFTSAESVLRLRAPGLFEVAGMGACTLFKARVLDGYERQNIDFTPVPGLNLWGEDRHMSVRLAAQGIKMHADTRQTPFHVYRESMLEEAKWWVEALTYDTSYFARNWLTADWVKSIKSVLVSEPKRRIVAFCLPGEQFSSLVRVFSNVYMTRNSIWEALRGNPEKERAQ